ncbi:MAG: aminotransferase [Peptococcaceae bacterium 1109]|jgi:LL-diaminopimelate aminotransferase|nr:MAG: aminotransferase [Peptococcaceae bacterium 1109]
MQESRRVRALPPYLFAQIEERIAQAEKKGLNIISLGIGDPDLPTPTRVVEALAEQARLPKNHRYPSSAGLFEFRKAAAEWCCRRFGVELDPGTEVTTLIGTKEGIANLPLCFLDPGDIALVPDPGYPVYTTGTLLAGGEVYKMPLLEENGFLPDLDSIPHEVLGRAKLMWLNYPNNPTAAVASKDFFAKAVALAKEYGCLLCHDAAYSEITFDGYLSPSILEIPEAKDVAVEFHSLSKTYNMTGWRIGWAAGNAQAVGALRRLKTNLDSGVFQPIQYAAMAALSEPPSQDVIRAYQERRDVVVNRLNGLGWNVVPPKATIYIWAPVPQGFTSLEFAEEVFEKTGVVITPGVGYGQYGEGYFRISLCLPVERFEEAFQRWETHGIRAS